MMLKWKNEKKFESLQMQTLRYGWDRRVGKSAAVELDRCRICKSTKT